jgi:hypothetical protein
MNRFVKILMLVAVMVALAGTYSYVAAQDELTRSGWTSPRTVANDGPPPVLATNHVLKATYINTCQPNCSSISLPAGSFVNLDGVTSISCTAPVGKTCTINLEAWIETQDLSGLDGNASSLNLVLDGAQAGQTFFCGSSPVTSGNDTGLAYKSVAITGVSKGTHTVQTQARSINGANGAAWQATYTVYVP